MGIARTALCTATLMLGLGAASAPARAATADAALRAAATKEQAAVIDTLRDLVTVESGSTDHEGVATLMTYLDTRLRALDAKVDRVASASGGPDMVRGVFTGKGTLRVMLIAHADTVYDRGILAREPYHRKGNLLYGPGIADDKGGVVIIVSALRAMHAAGTLRDADIKVVLTGDEESAGTPLAAARADLVAAGKWADVALEYEELIVRDGQDYATVARRGVTDWELATSGVTGHSGSVFGSELGYGANYELVRILDAFRRELPEPDLTLNVGLMVGGTPATLEPGGARGSAAGKTNIIAEQAIARGDLRTMAPEQETRARARMQAIVAQHLPKTGATLVYDESYPPMAPTAGNRALLAMLNQVNADLGLPAMKEWDPAKRGAADSSFVAADVDVLAGLGAAGRGAHAEGESLDLASIPRQSLRSAVLIDRLSRMPR